MKGVNKKVAKIDNNAICQIAIVVKDIETVAANYAKLFDIPVPEIFTIPSSDEVPIYYRGKMISSKTKLCVFNMGPIVLELTQPDDVPSAWKEYLDKHGQGVHHLGIQVQDRGTAVEAFKEIGAEVIHIGYYPTSSYSFVDSEEQLGVRFNIKHDGEDNSDKIMHH
jgi:4-hydroxyphenylpyruvate dioxygenase-like putative hemolysin